jgi:hypothetical protein
MLKPFFVTAMLAPGRHLTFRRVVGFHVAVLAALAWSAARAETSGTLTAVGYLALVLGIVEGAALVGWRLTQLPKSQALEFLLVSPVRPRRVFLAEALVGVSRFALVCLSGLPVLVGMVLAGVVEPADLWVLAAMPLVWGVVAGLGLTAWAYEPYRVRRVGELLGLLGVLVYLVVGILAGENLRLWLQKLPPEWAARLYQWVMVLHNGNPFGVVRNWFDPGRVPAVSWRQFEELHLLAAGLIALIGLRAAFRLKGHFHDRHYRPITSDRAAQTRDVGERPLSWWAVRRVMEYSGRSNLYLAGGFSLLYAAYLVVADQWPPWMGRLVFQIFETWGGAPMVAAAMCVMAAVPAAFQFGLWDPTVTDRCKRLELLLLTELDAPDYWRASLAAAWRRGRGYLLIAAVLWLALAVSGRVAWYEAVAAAAGGALLWAFSFAVGFRAFSTANQANGVASLLTIGLPLLLFTLLRAGLVNLAALVPTAACYLPLRDGLTWAWAAGFALTAAATVGLTRRGLARCVPELRRWYDANQGRKTD